MDKGEKKRLKAQFRKNEQDVLRVSIPMGIEELKGLLSYLNRADAPECNHDGLRDTREYIESKNLDPDKIMQWLRKHGGYCDCEVISNVYYDVGRIVGWHLGRTVGRHLGK